MKLAAILNLLSSGQGQEDGSLLKISLIVGIIVGIGTLLYYVTDILMRKSKKPDSNEKEVMYSMDTVKDCVDKIVSQIKDDAFVPSLIIGIGRGGGIFGALISYKLYHLPLIVIDRDYDWETGDRMDNVLFNFEIPASMMKRILLVAGEAHTGKTMGLFKDYLRNTGAGEIKTCVFYKEIGSTTGINYYGDESVGIPLMPWQDEKYIRDSISKKNSEALQELRQKAFKLEGKKVFVVRHGETNNKSDVFIGVTESNLNANGQQQIKELAEYLLNKECLKPEDSIILSSDQDRCIETSTIIHDATGIEIRKKKELRERNFGQWEGLSRQKIKTKFPEDYEQYEKNPLLSCPPGGDSLLTIIGNIYKVLDRIEKSEEKNTIIVTHKTTGKLLLTILTHSFYSKFREQEFTNGSISKFVFVRGEIQEEYLNKTSF